MIHKFQSLRKAACVSSVVVITIVGVLLVLPANYRSMIDVELPSRARSHFANMVLTRRWNAQYGGVFVEKTEGVISDSHLNDPDITTVDGKVYTKMNPALMPREVSEIAQKDGSFRFHITSLKPLNSGNAPDAFETEPLLSFQEGETKVASRIARLSISKVCTGNSCAGRGSRPIGAVK